jgi:hypothetical protein
MLPVDAGIADRPADRPLAEDRRLKTVVSGQLDLRPADELDRVLERLAGRPRQPSGQERPVRLDQSMKLVRVRLIEQAEPCGV